MARKLITIILCALVLAMIFEPIFYSDDHHSALQKFTPREEKDFSEKMVTLINAQDFIAFKKNVDSALPLDGKLFKQLVEQLPEGTPVNINVIGAYTQISKGVSHYSLTFEYQYPDKWVEIMFALRKQADMLLIEGLQIVPLKDSIENLCRFTLKGSLLVQQVALLLAIAVLAFDLYALLRCMYTPIPKYKWLWVLFILAGVDVSFGFNWLSGFFIDRHHIGLMIPVVTFSKGLYWPLVIAIRLPLGAIIFLLKRKKYLAQGQNIPVTH